MTVCPVLESIRVVTGSQRQVTVLAFSCLLITQCSMASALAGGIWLGQADDRIELIEDVAHKSRAAARDAENQNKL